MKKVIPAISVIKKEVLMIKMMKSWRMTLNWWELSKRQNEAWWATLSKQTTMSYWLKSMKVLKRWSPNSPLFETPSSMSWSVWKKHSNKRYIAIFGSYQIGFIRIKVIETKVTRWVVNNFIIMYLNCWTILWMSTSSVESKKCLVGKSGRWMYCQVSIGCVASTQATIVWCRCRANHRVECFKCHKNTQASLSSIHIIDGIAATSTPKTNSKSKDASGSMFTRVVPVLGTSVVLMIHKDSVGKGKIVKDPRNGKVGNWVYKCQSRIFQSNPWMGTSVWS